MPTHRPLEAEGVAPGMLLLAIDDRDVRDKPHTEVRQLLRKRTCKYSRQLVFGHPSASQLQALLAEHRQRQRQLQRRQVQQRLDQLKRNPGSRAAPAKPLYAAGITISVH